MYYPGRMLNSPAGGGVDALIERCEQKIELSLEILSHRVVVIQWQLDVF